MLFQLSYKGVCRTRTKTSYEYGGTVRAIAIGPVLDWVTDTLLEPEESNFLLTVVWSVRHGLEPAKSLDVWFTITLL